MTYAESQIYNRASEYLETRRIPDPYYYVLNSQGRLALGYTGEVVENQIETESYLGKAEYKGFIELQRWTNKNDSGKAVWISPPYTGIYDSPKIIVSEILKSDGIKILFNRAIVLDGFSSTDCFLFARDLAGYFPQSIEELRANPIPLPQDLNWMDKLSHYIDISEIRSAIESGTDIAKKEEIIRELWARKININQHGFYGNKPLRCERRSTVFQLTSENALQYDIYGDRNFECPHCHQINTRPENKLIATCQHCGSDVRCGSSS